MEQYLVYINSNVGKARLSNQDNFAVNEKYNIDCLNYFESEFTITSEHRLTASVFDGMGGLQNGEKAAHIAAECFADEAKKDTYYSCFDLIYKCNDLIAEEIRDTKIKMGSTIVTCDITNGKADFYNVGDSRAYYYDGADLKLLTVDHSYQNGIEEIGHKRNGALTQFLGIPEDEFIIEPYEVRDMILKENDIILLCTDGLYSFLTNEEIASAIKSEGSPNCIAKSMIETALGRGGTDNITVVMIKYSFS